MGARLLPRTLPELFSYALAIEREAAKRYRELARTMRAIGVDDLADELERIGREEEEQHELIELGTSGRKLPDFAGWELCWHYVAAGAPQHAPRSPREALASALAFERHTHAFYLDVAESARDDAVRAFSAEMANDEQRHIGRLEVLLEQEPDPAAGAEAANLQFRLI
jgi:rubrerythrin